MTHVGFWEGIARDLTGRGMFGGRFQLRLIVQPLIAMILGIRLGLHDAKQGKPAFFASVVTGGRHGLGLLRQGLRDAIVPLCVAFVLDGVLQYLILGHVRPAAAVVVGLLLVFFPFVLAAGGDESAVEPQPSRGRAARALSRVRHAGNGVFTGRQVA